MIGISSIIDTDANDAMMAEEGQYMTELPSEKPVMTVDQVDDYHSVEGHTCLSSEIQAVDLDAHDMGPSPLTTVSVDLTMLEDCDDDGTDSVGPNCKKATPGEGKMTVAKLLRKHSGGSVLRLRNVPDRAYLLHPDTLADLVLYHQWLQGKLASHEMGLEEFLLPTTFYPLVAKLVQDRHTEDMSFLEDVLLPFCDRRLALVKLHIGPIDCIIPDFVRQFASFTLYGLEEDALERSKNGCGLWEVRNLDWLGPNIASEVVRNRQEREASKALLKELYTASNNHTNLSVQPPLVDLKGSTSESPAKPKAKVKVAPNNQKLSSFFTITKKPANYSTIEGNEQASVVGDLGIFQPFYVKQHVTVAPINHFSEKNPHEYFGKSSGDLARYFAQALVSIKAKRGKLRATCLGLDGIPEQLVMKLLQFKENYRPAYHGTWRHENVKKFMSLPRRPFNPLLEDVDYDFDSDEEWGDDEDVGDAESINSNDDDEEEEEDEEEDEERDWMVPDGYLSEDEGSVNAMPVAKKEISSPSKVNASKKRKLIVLQPKITADPQSISLLFNFRLIKLSASGEEAKFAFPIDPFEGCQVVPKNNTSELGDEASSEKPAKSTSSLMLSEKLLPSLAHLISKSALGVGRLYDQFVERYGIVSKRQFELRINQIASKQKDLTLGKPVWNIRDEYLYLLQAQPESNPVQSSDTAAAFEDNSNSLVVSSESVCE